MNSELLIELVRDYTFLYDIQDKKYSDSQKKDAAWREIARKLKTSDKECKRAWNALRDGFRRAIKRQKEPKSGPIKKWKFEDELAFLIPYLKERPSTSINRTEGEIYDEENTSDMERMPEDNTIVPIITMTQPGPAKHLAPVRVPPSEDNSTALLMNYLLNKKEEDDIDIFFSSMAATVRTFPPRERAIAKARVFSEISKLELEILSPQLPSQSI